MFDRLINLIGVENFNKIENTNILVLGCGGVGGHAIEALVRSGIKKITVVDDDVIDKTNINRQIIALNSTIGQKKVCVIKKRMLDINPTLNITTIDKRLDSENIYKLNLETYDYIVDAIDDTKVKIELIKFSLEKKIKLITATGTAKKMHPEMLKITTLDKTRGDALARKLRTSLKGYDLKKIVCLASEEAPIKTENDTLGSTAFTPPVGGLLIAGYIINDIIK